MNEEGSTKVAAEDSLVRYQHEHEHPVFSVSGDLAAMHRPEVMRLRYQIDIRYTHYVLIGKPPRRDIAFGDFACVLTDNVLEARPKVTYADADDAHAALLAYLQSWEAHAELTGQLPITFRLVLWEMVDRAPTSGKPEAIMAVGSQVVGADPYHEEVRHHEYPSLPPDSFRQDEVVRLLRRRWRDVYEYRALPSVEGYFLLTTLEGLFRGRKEAVRLLKIDQHVLQVLGAITAAEDPLRGRKRQGEKAQSVRGKVGPLSPDEEHWLFVLACNVMYRLAMGPNMVPGRLSLADLPPWVAA